ncbi:hypothetical protein KS4_03930 [Poriferisphaera corsica]|uniref:Uncharacterized protein n=1 Tax=Poriferisphaera corsica TaxID=2528020 RepID=A0A517YQ73_9BACT|nr:hypothetical protein KS4_03930 [Poriferisphaera corsica]
MFAGCEGVQAVEACEVFIEAEHSPKRLFDVNDFEGRCGLRGFDAEARGGGL